MLIKSNFKTSVTHEFGDLDVEASTLASVNTAQKIGVSFGPELATKRKLI